LGYSTSFVPDADGVGVLVETEPGARVRHRVEIHDVAGWCQLVLAFDPRRGVTWFDWLATSSHRLAEVTTGAVFHDGLGELGPLRSRLAYYPTDVWLFILASHGSASPRRKPSSHAARRSATPSAQRSSLGVSSGT
jgi:hypothetical protein